LTDDCGRSGHVRPRRAGGVHSKSSSRSALAGSREQNSGHVGAMRRPISSHFRRMNRAIDLAMEAVCAPHPPARPRSTIARERGTPAPLPAPRPRVQPRPVTARIRGARTTAEGLPLYRLCISRGPTKRREVPDHPRPLRPCGK